VSPPWFWRRTCTRASAIVRQTADRRVGGRRCNRVRGTTGGLRPPALGRAGVRRPTELRLLRCTHAHAQERRALDRRDCGYRDCDAGRRCSVGSLSHMEHRHCERVTVIHGGLTPPALGPARPVVVCERVRNLPRRRGCRNHGGLTPPRSWSRAVRPPTELRLLRCTNAHARGGRVSARRGSYGDGPATHTESCPPNRDCRTKSDGCKPAVADGQRTCKGASAIAWQTAAGELADAVAMALPQPLL